MVLQVLPTGTRQKGSRDERLQMQAGIKNRYSNGKSDDQAKEEISTEATR